MKGPNKSAHRQTTYVHLLKVGDVFREFHVTNRTWTVIGEPSIVKRSNGVHEYRIVVVPVKECETPLMFAERARVKLWNDE